MKKEKNDIPGWLIFLLFPFLGVIIVSSIVELIPVFFTLLGVIGIVIILYMMIKSVIEIIRDIRKGNK